METARSSRRRLLGQMLAGGALILPGGLWLACAKPPAAPRRRRSEHYFVFYYMMGGWDITTLTDPLSPGPRRDLSYRPDEVFEAGAHRWGPMMAPVRPWFDRLAVVRGIKSLALNHPQARFALVTGKFKEPGQQPEASVQSLIAQRFGAEYELPNLSSDSMRPASFLGDLDGHVKPMRFQDLEQLRALVQVEGPVASYEARIQRAIQERDALLVKRYEAALAGQFHSYAELARKVRRSDLAQRLDPSAPPLFTERSLVKHRSRWGQQANLVIEVVRQDLAPVISVGSGEFDAHNASDYGNHHNDIKRGMETVAAILEGLERAPHEAGGTMLDRTTVVVASEFSREPWINELGGKHHWPANSLLIFGKGVRRSADKVPVVFGETDEELFTVRVDPATGSTTGKKADDLLITHANATLLAMAGLDGEALMEAEPIPAVMA